MPFSLPSLPYAYDALEPHIDAQTMEIHHTKHHQAYVTNLNTALEGVALPSGASIQDVIADLSALPEARRTAVRNNGGGHANHSMFWTIMAPGMGGQPSGELARAIDTHFGSFDAFREQLTQAGMTRFGSGWAWLTLAPDGLLAVESTANQDSPIMDGRFPIMGVDVWEHAYYLKYQNRRADYLAAWWNTVHWSEVADRYASGLAAFK
jgi:Fe-Mn family superoxide dismutase